MGTCIDCFIPCKVNRDPCEIKVVLQAVFEASVSDLKEIGQKGFFSKMDSDWWVEMVQEEEGEPAYIMGEGPRGFMLDVFDRVICVTSQDRFHTLYADHPGILLPLRRVFSRCALALGGSTTYALAAGGMGDTDHARDAAYYEKASFTVVCDILQEHNGEPASDWSQMHELQWYCGSIENVPLLP